MIRRDAGNDWLLISQVDHAHLSGRVAAVWGNETVPRLPVPDDLVPAIRDHDEGWRDWERHPQVDPESGRPRQFTEMPMRESTAVWSESIRACLAGDPSHATALSRFQNHLDRQGIAFTERHGRILAAVLTFHYPFRPDEIAAILDEASDVAGLLEQLREAGIVRLIDDSEQGPLAGPDLDQVSLSPTGYSYLGGIWVSRHFCWLAEQARQHRTDPDDLAAIDSFLREQNARQQEWRNRAAGALNDEQLEALIRNGFRFVQLFDRLSLWLCCAPRTDPHEIGFPVDQSIRLVPEYPSEVRIDPWPLSVDHLDVSAPARRIPARRYADDADLHETLRAAPVETLRWTLRRL